METAHANATTTSGDDSGPAAAVDRIAAFLTGIGLDIEWGATPDDAFLPGVLVIRNGLRIDRERLRYPGDLLHEAGHLAGLTEAARHAPQPVVDADPGLEMMALAWSYAAAVALGVPAHVLFHADGYKGWGPSLAQNFTDGRYVGVPMLQYFGLACEPRQAAERGVPAYPHMLRWLRA